MSTMALVDVSEPVTSVIRGQRSAWFEPQLRDALTSVEASNLGIRSLGSVAFCDHGWNCVARFAGCHVVGGQRA